MLYRSRWPRQVQYCLQGILKGEVSQYHWPPVRLVWNQLYDYWQVLFLFAKQTNKNQSNRSSMVQWYCPPLVFPAVCHVLLLPAVSQKKLLPMQIPFKRRVSYFYILLLFLPIKKEVWFMAVFCMVEPGNTNWKGRLSTIHLLPKKACFVAKVDNFYYKNELI